jgi:hypothetical protein
LLGSRAEELEDNVLKSVTKKWSIVKLGRKEEVSIGDNFFAVSMKKLYKYIDKRESSLIKYMVKSSFLAGRGSFQFKKYANILFKNFPYFETIINPIFYKNFIIFEI